MSNSDKKTKYQMQKTARSFTGVWIPKSIWFDKNLLMSEKLFYVEINSLDNEDSCYASNAYFAQFFDISKNRVSAIIGSLVKKGYIKNTLIYKQGSKEIDKRILSIVNTTHTYKKVGGILKNSKGITEYNNIDTKEVSIMGVKHSLKQLQIKYNPILNRTMIGMGGYKTRINDDKSKTMISVYKHLVRLQHNKFLTGKDLTTKSSLKSRDTYQIEKVMTDDQLEALLKKAAKRWWLIYTDENYYAPENRPGLSDFFYNPETKMSYFIYCSCCTLLKKKESNQINKLESLKLGLRKLEPKLKELSLKLYSNSIINGFNVEDSMAFYSNIKNLITWRLENKEHLEKVNEGWVTLFGVNRIMFNTVSRFMQEQGTEYLPNFLIVDGYLWNDFNEWCIDGYGVNLKGRK